MEIIGPHKVLNGSVESLALDSMLAGEKVRILYSDPPWGEGNVKYWATINKRHTGVEVEPLTYRGMLDRIMNLIDCYVDGHVFIETGPAFSDELQGLLSERLVSVTRYDTLYRSGSRMRDCVLLYGSTRKTDSLNGFNPSGMTGYAQVRDCLKAVAEPNAIVLDPMCGMGYTAKATLQAGMVFRGNELNAKRLAKTIAVLQKGTR